MITVTDIAYHRNGVSGEPFYVVAFTHDIHNMVAIVFKDTSYVAVFDRDLLGRGTIGFAVNSWRGDFFESDLRRAIDDYNLEPTGKGA